MVYAVVCVCACVVHVFTRVYTSVRHICVHATMCMHVCVFARHCVRACVCCVCMCVCVYMHAFWYACLHVGMCKIFLPTSTISVSFYVVNSTVSR